MGDTGRKVLKLKKAWQCAQWVGRKLGKVIKPVLKKTAGAIDDFAGQVMNREGQVAVKGGQGVLPSIDATGKVHGVLPKVQDLANYTKEELEILVGELKQSVQKRIEVTSKLGRDRAHGQRQGAEQDLIKSIEKFLTQ